MVSSAVNGGDDIERFLIASGIIIGSLNLASRIFDAHMHAAQLESLFAGHFDVGKVVHHFGEASV